MQFECCGVNGPSDWMYTSDNVFELPMSCCLIQGFDALCTEKESYQIGCQSAIVDYLQLSLDKITQVYVGTILVQVNLL